MREWGDNRRCTNEWKREGVRDEKTADQEHKNEMKGRKKEQTRERRTAKTNQQHKRGEDTKRKRTREIEIGRREKGAKIDRRYNVKIGWKTTRKEI